MPNDTIDTKTCAKCKNLIPATLEYFSKDKTKDDGLQTWCKACMREYHREYREINRDKLNEQNRKYRLDNIDKELLRSQKYYQANKDKKVEYYENNKEKIDEYHQKYRLINKSKSLEYAREYRRLNKNKLYSKNRAYYQANKDKVLKQNREYYQANKDQRSEYARKWRRANPDKKRISSARRNARKRSLPSTFTEQQWIACLEYFNYTCAVCSSQLRDLFGDVEPHADHWIPLSSDKCTGTVATNMVCLCSDCNLNKGAKMPDVWLKEKYGTRKANEILKRIDDYFNGLE